MDLVHSVYKGSSLLINNNNTTNHISLLDDATLAVHSESFINAGSIVMATFNIILAVLTITGNCVVIMSIVLVKRLKTPSNMLILNMALCDLMVGAIVMPIATKLTISNGQWVLGGFLCDFWTSVDVLLCTSSILNFLMISIDRYLIISKPFAYRPRRTFLLMAIFCVLVWTLSAGVSLGPVFGWGLPSDNLPECIVNQSLSYQIFATLLSFFIPLMLVLILYFHIYRVANMFATKRETPDLAVSRPHLINNVDTGYNKDGTIGRAEHDQSVSRRMSSLSIFAYCARSQSSNSHNDNSPENTDNGNQRHKHSADARSLGNAKPKLRFATNQKAIHTLGVILGCFCVCWLPFFMNALVKPIFFHLRGVNIPSPWWLDPFLLWLGYINSLFNPIIYSLFNVEFQEPFKLIMTCQCRGINGILRRKTYAEQFGNVQV